MACPPGRRPRALHLRGHCICAGTAPASWWHVRLWAACPGDGAWPSLGDAPASVPTSTATSSDTADGGTWSEADERGSRRLLTSELSGSRSDARSDVSLARAEPRGACPSGPANRTPRPPAGSRLAVLHCFAVVGRGLPLLFASAASSRTIVEIGGHGRTEELQQTRRDAEGEGQVRVHEGAQAEEAQQERKRNALTWGLNSPGSGENVTSPRLNLQPRWAGLRNPGIRP